MNKQALFEQVKSEIACVVPFSSDVKLGECKSFSYLGLSDKEENTIKVSIYVENEQDFKDIVAHELIHNAGVDNHGKVFKEYCVKINNLGLGYNVQTTAKHCIDIKRIRELRKKSNENKKQYLVYCSNCGWCRVYRKKENLSHYHCPHCRRKALKQKIYKEGVTFKYRGEQ